MQVAQDSCIQTHGWKELAGCGKQQLLAARHQGCKRKKSSWSAMSLRCNLCVWKEHTTITFIITTYLLN
jgi:hypothetical protein